MGKWQISTEWVDQCLPFPWNNPHFQQKTKSKRNLALPLKPNFPHFLFLIFILLALKVKLCSTRNIALSVEQGNQLSQLPEGYFLNLPKLFVLYSHLPKMYLHPGQLYIQFSPWSLWNGTQDNNWVYFRNTQVTVILIN